MYSHLYERGGVIQSAVDENRLTLHVDTSEHVDQLYEMTYC